MNEPPIECGWTERVIAVTCTRCGKTLLHRPRSDGNTSAGTHACGPILNAASLGDSTCQWFLADSLDGDAFFMASWVAREQIEEAGPWAPLR